MADTDQAPPRLEPRHRRVFISGPADAAPLSEPHAKQFSAVRQA